MLNQIIIIGKVVEVHRKDNMDTRVVLENKDGFVPVWFPILLEEKVSVDDLIAIKGTVYNNTFANDGSVKVMVEKYTNTKGDK